VNNAGISVMGLIWEISDADWDRSIDINYRGVVNGVRAFVPRMLASPEQTYICNVASLASFSMDRSVAPYFTTKHAVLSLSECLYIEMMDQPNPVRISATVPGFIATRIFGGLFGMDHQASQDLAHRVRDHSSGANPIGRAGQPQDIAEAVLYLASDAARFVTGTHITVDGGITIGPRHSWDPKTTSPMSQALGVTREQIEAMRKPAHS